MKKRIDYGFQFMVIIGENNYQSIEKKMKESGGMLLCLKKGSAEEYFYTKEDSLSLFV